MTDLWPWLAIAGAGALHGASPASGWPVAALCSMHARDTRHGRHALWSIGLGQAASIAVTAAGLSLGLAIDRGVMGDAAVALIVGAAAWHLRRGRGQRVGLAGATQRRGATLAVGSFLVASAQGAGLMLVPALAPMCAGASLARAATTSPAWAVALGAVVLHLASMMVAAGLVASGARRAFARYDARRATRSGIGRILQGGEALRTMPRCLPSSNLSSPAT